VAQIIVRDRDAVRPAPRPTCTRRPAAAPPAGRRFGYLVSAAINGVALWIVGHLLAWGWPPFLTPAFDDLLPYLQVSLVATIVVDLLWAWRDPAWWRHTAQIGLNLIGLVVVVRSWQIFPFDLSDGWETLARVLLGVAFVGLIAATVAEIVELVRGADADARGPA
jgi:hypothetical protein